MKHIWPPQNVQCPEIEDGMVMELDFADPVINTGIYMKMTGSKTLIGLKHSYMSYFLAGQFTAAGDLAGQKGSFYNGKRILRVWNSLYDYLSDCGIDSLNR